MAKKENKNEGKTNLPEDEIIITPQEVTDLLKMGEEQEKEAAESKKMNKSSSTDAEGDLKEEAPTKVEIVNGKGTIYINQGDKAIPMEVDEETLLGLGLHPSQTDSQESDSENTERIETPLQSDFDPDSKPSNATFMSWMTTHEDLGVVEVSESDKEDYWRSMLHDTPFTINIDINAAGKDVSIKVRSISNIERDAVIRAAAMDEEDNIISGIAAFCTRIQYYCLAIQALSIDNSPLEIFELRKFNPEKQSTKEHIDSEAERLRRWVGKTIYNSNIGRWELLNRAVRIFEHKLKMCNDGLLNKDFWRPVDTA